MPSGGGHIINADRRQSDSSFFELAFCHVAKPYSSVRLRDLLIQCLIDGVSKKRAIHHILIEANIKDVLVQDCLWSAPDMRSE